MKRQIHISFFLACLTLFAIWRPVAAQEQASRLRELLIGEWTAISVVSSGKETAIPGERTQEFSLKFTEKDFEGREHKAKRDEADRLKGTYLLDTDVQPATLDLVLESAETVKIVGIVRIEGGKLILCVDSIMGRLKRPKTFESTESSGIDLLVFKRVANDK